MERPARLPSTFGLRMLFKHTAMIAQPQPYIHPGHSTQEPDRTGFLGAVVATSTAALTSHESFPTTEWPVKQREIHNHHFDSTVWNDFVFRPSDVVIATY